MTSFKTNKARDGEKKKNRFKEYNNYSLKEAREALQRIFVQDDLCEGDRNPSCRRALSLLTLHPQLASEMFQASDEEDAIRFLPLSIFVASGASLDAIRAVYELYPKAVSTKHPDLLLYPLQAACEVHAEYDVITFLLDKCPEAVMSRDYKGDLAIHSVLGQGKEQIPKRKTVNLLLELYPECVAETNSDGACPLAVAFRNHRDNKIMDKIIEKRLAQGVDSFKLLAWEGSELQAADVSRLTMEVLPKLKLNSFRCEPEGYTKDGFCYLMEALTSNDTIEKLILAFPPLNGGGRSQQFLRFLKKNYTVKHLTLTRNLNLWSRASGVDSLLQGLKKNETLETLRLSGLFLLSSFEVGYLVSQAPHKLVLNTVMIESRWRAGNHSNWADSKVEDLTIRNCKMRGSTLDRILEALQKLPMLEKLTLDFSNPEDKHDAENLKNRDITKPIAALLKLDRLEYLELHGLKVDIHKLKLHNNKTLKTLRLDSERDNLSLNVGVMASAFVKGNTSLQEVKFHCDYNHEKMEPDGDGQMRPSYDLVDDPAINYYTGLNRTGSKTSLLHTVMTMNSMPEGKAKADMLRTEYEKKVEALLHTTLTNTT